MTNRLNFRCSLATWGICLFTGGIKQLKRIAMSRQEIRRKNPAGQNGRQQECKMRDAYAKKQYVAI